MEPIPNNPAGRIHLLMINAKALANQTTGQQFPILLDYPPNDTIAMHRRFAAVLNEIDEAEHLLKNFDPQLHAMFMGDRQSVVNFFSVGINPSVDWNQYKTQHLREEALRTLQFWSLALSRMSPERETTAEALADFEKKLNDLYSYVAESDLDPALKGRILGGLNDIRNSIHEYRIVGLKALEKAVAAFGVEVHSTEESGSVTSPSWPDIYDKLSTFVDGATKGFALWEKIRPLREMVKQFLLPTS